jgi:3-hydroxyacyl-CoA dehydrogenase
MVWSTQIVSDDLVPSAISYAQWVATEKHPLTRARDRDDKLADLRANPAKFDELAAPYAKRARGLHAPAKALEALRWTLDVPVAEALIRERDAFIELKEGRAVEGAASHLLCRARGGEGFRPAEGREAA